MKQNSAGSLVREIMTEFADMTGLAGAGKAPSRYLWTDAFAVCNFLELYHQTDKVKYKNLALNLVDQVHDILGRHRKDSRRTGWISGLDEQEGIMHPTKGGLRIGKKGDERKPHEPFDERLEWDRDGQYYHYLTKWMHALNRVSKVTGDSTYNTWAIELAKTAHARFTHVPPSGGHMRMYWKMSIDLSYPLIHSMGQHDPLDGFITYSQLQATASKYFKKAPGPDLNTEINDMADICKGKSWVTGDPLGIGDLLCNACKAAQLIINNNFEQTGLLETLLVSSLPGLKSFMREGLLRLPADYRLAFRELGLSIGLHAVEKMKGLIGKNPASFNKKDSLHLLIEDLMQYVALSETIEKFWLESTNTRTTGWTEHLDINMVMLATSLTPDSYLTL